MNTTVTAPQPVLNALIKRWETAATYPDALAMERLLHPDYVTTPTLRLISNDLRWAASTPGARLALSMPPQEGKTELVRALIVRELAINPNLRIGLGSYNQQIATGGGRAIRNAIQSHPELGIRLAHDTRSKAEWKIAGYNGGMIARGRGSGISGNAIDLMVIDDPFKEGEAQSEAVREEAWLWWQQGIAARFGPETRCIVVMTRWHMDDLIGRLIKHDSHAGWRIRNIPAQCDDEATDPLGRQLGEYMISARGRTDKDWEDRKLTLGSQAWNALCQGRPSPAEGGMVKRHWWQQYATPLWEERPDGTCWTTGFDELLISADLAFKGTQHSDRVALGVWARRGADAYLLDLIADRLDFVSTVHAFSRLAAKWPQAILKLVEDKANGPALISMLARRIPGIVPHNPKVGKVPRLLAVAPLIESGNVHIPTTSLAPWVDDYIEEHAAFPNGAHDDQVDMTSQGLDRLLIRPLSELGTAITEADDYDDWRIGY